MKNVRIPSLIVICYGVILFVSLGASNCVNEPSYSTTPQIEFKGISRYSLGTGAGVGQQKRDSLVITIGFKDGDGDLGDNLPISAADTARYLQAGGWGSYRIKTFRLEDNQFKEIPSREDNALFFPQLGREGKKEPIEGTIDFRQTYQYTNSYRNYLIKYRIQLRDRALTSSNEIETDTITVPFPDR
ncbi:hypothetical protein GCM10028808_49100 [Spirosoma migulaei]